MQFDFTITKWIDKDHAEWMQWKRYYREVLLLIYNVVNMDTHAPTFTQFTEFLKVIVPGENGLPEYLDRAVEVVNRFQVILGKTTVGTFLAEYDKVYSKIHNFDIKQYVDGNTHIGNLA